MKISFAEWLQLNEASRRPGTKSGLYPLGYDGIGNYPPADILTVSADAITYLDMDDRIFKTHEGRPFNIKHIPSSGNVIPPKEHGMPGKEIPYKMNYIIPQPKYKMPPGEVVRPTSWVKLVTDPELRDPKEFDNAP